MIKNRARAATKLNPMAHQAISLTHDKTTPVVFDLSDPGTGKTAVRIWSFAERRRKRGGRLLVLAPRTLLRTAWANDFQKFAPDMKVVVADAANRKVAFASDADVYITNHDAVKDLVKLPKALWDTFSEYVVDESPAYKHHTSQRSRSMAKLAGHRGWKRRAMLTATPNSNGITDIWHQVYLLDGGKRLGPTFYGFRNSVCTPSSAFRGSTIVKWEDKPGAEDAVFGLLTDIVVRHKFEDCVDIPETHSYSLEYELTPKQRKIYDEMELTNLMWLKQQGKVTAVNAAAVATKLLQIASGAVYDNAGEYHVVDKARYELLLDLAIARKHPLMLFFWKHQKDLLVEEAEKRDLRYAVLDGSTSDAERMGIVTRYQMGAYDIVFGHPQTVAHGLTLTRGTSIIWPGPTYNLEWWLQANRRQARIGQTMKTEVVTVIAPGTIEEKVYAACMMKGERQFNLLDLFSSMMPTTPAAVFSSAVSRKLVAV